jgi:hypothetical protein
MVEIATCLESTRRRMYDAFVVRARRPATRRGIKCPRSGVTVIVVTTFVVIIIGVIITIVLMPET